MFEKEAYEWTEKNISAGISMYNPSIEMYCGKAFKDGAEFGYNKANEWHDLRKNPNDLPTCSYKVLVFTDEGVGFGIYGLDDKKWHTYDTGFQVILWKEIVLSVPKEG